MNPIQIGSANISQFGFKSTFDLLANTLTFDITGLTVFNTGGAAAVAGIAFAVTDPSGLQLATIDFSNPQIHPASSSTYVLNLVSGFAKFGWYTITGSIKDADASLHPITIKKEICRPYGFENGVAPGQFEINTDCDAQLITIKEITKILYKGLTPIQSLVTGILSYPPGTIADLSFTATPFVLSGGSTPFAGRYTVNNNTAATFDLGDQVFVILSFKTVAFETFIYCGTRLASLLGCITSLQSDYDQEPYGNTGIAAKLKLDAVVMPLMIAIIKEKSGYDVGADVDKIAKILNC